MPRILIMSDSTCDLPAAWIRQHDIRIVPTYVQFGQESLADDGVQLRRTEFYERLAASSTLPTTSAPSVGQTLEVMSQALDDADHVIAFTAPAELSAIYSIFHLAAEQLAPERVTIIDSRMVTMGLGWQVIQAAELAAAGHPPAEIEAAVRAMQPRTDVWAALDTLEYLRRSGRVGWAAAFVGELFHIKPIVRLHDAVVSSVARVRTSQNAFRALVTLAHEAAPLERLAILHTNNIERARELVAALTDIHPQGDVPVVDVTPVIGVHVGPRGLGLGLVRKQVQE